MADDLIPDAIAGTNIAPQSSGTAKGVDYRQLQEPEEVDVRQIDRDADAASSEAQRRAEELSNTFKQFNNTVHDITDPILVRGGAKAGAAAGAAGNGAPKTGLQAATLYGRSFNAAVHQTYITQSQLSMEQQLSDIEGKNTGNPTGFQTQAGAAANAALKNMDPLYQPEMQLWAQNRIQAGVNRQSDQKANDVRNNALATYQSATPTLITGALHTAAALPGPQGDAVIAKLVSDDQDRLNALVASRTITPEQAVTMHQRMVADTHNQMTGQKVDLSLQPILQTMRSNVEASDKLIVQDDPNLTPEENQTRVHEYEQERQQYEQTQTRARVQDLTAVHQQLANGQFGPAVEQTLHGLYRAGALSQEGLFSGMAESLRNQKARIGDEADMQLVDAVVHGERQGPLDPKDSAQAAAVDKYFQEHVTQSGAVSDPQYAAGAAEIFRQTGILPASVQSKIRVGLMSGDPVRAAAAAALAAKVQGVNPTADAFVGNPHLTALAGLINDNIKAGIEPNRAYAMAQANVNQPQGERKIRDAGYAAALKTSGPNAPALQKQLDAATPGMFAHSPPAPIAMQAEFEGLVRQFYSQTGDINKARQLAGSQLRQTWNVTTVNGSPELMKHGIPQEMLPTVRADIASSARSAGYTGDPSSIHVVPNAQTDNSGGKIWSLVHVDPTTGLSDTLLGKDNRPLVYHLPSGPDFAKARQQLVEQKLAQARELRDAQRANSADQIMYEQQLSAHYLQGNPGQRQMEGR